MEPVGVNENHSKKINRNASADMYGYVFQVCAGIVIMLDHIKDFSSIKIEGLKEDIEVHLGDKVVYAQAKSYTKPGPDPNGLAKFKDALQSLKEASENGDYYSLVFVSNIINPFGGKDKIEMGIMEKAGEFSFKTLTAKQQNLIKSCSGTGFPYDFLKIRRVNFFGEGIDRFGYLNERIKGLINQIDMSISVDIIRRIWFEEFFCDGTEKPTEDKPAKLDKKRIMLPVLYEMIKGEVPEERVGQIIDTDIYDEVLTEYDQLIENMSCDIELFNQVIGDYNAYYVEGKKRNDIKLDFINNKWSTYSDYFCLNIDKDEKECVIKLTLYKIINKKKSINKFNEEICLWK